MPSVDAAMASSLRGGILEQLKHVVARRDVLADAADKAIDVKTAFSSWDNCMMASFCKWPVIAIIVVGSLIVFSIVWCIIRCACCGRSCCCSCFRCLKCCGNCCGCCDPPGGRPHKYLDEPYVPPNHGYQAQAPMQAPMASSGGGKPPLYEPLQYAEFDVSKKQGEDSLPEMPSWENGSSKKVMLEDDEVEMDRLNKSSASNPAQPPLPSPSSGPASYMSSSHATGQGRHSPGQGQHNLGPYSSLDQTGYNASGFAMDGPFEYGAAGGVSRGPPMSTHNYMSNGQDQPYGPLAVAPTGPRRPSPAQGPNGHYIEMPAEPMQPGAYDQWSTQGPPAGYGMRRQGTGDSVARMGNPPPFGVDSRMRDSPGPRRTPGPRGDDPYYSSPRGSPGSRAQHYGQPGHDFPPNHGNRTYSPAPGRQRSPGYPGMPSQNSPFAHSPPESPITNNAGFDFTSGYSRPSTYDQSPSEPQRSPTRQLYPGYKPYQPTTETWGAV